MKKNKETEGKVPSYEPDVVEKELYKVFSPEWLEHAAEETGLIKRERKIKSVIMFWVLVIALEFVLNVILQASSGITKKLLIVN